MAQSESDSADGLDHEFAHFLEESPVEIYIFDTQLMKFVQVSRAARKNLGYSLDELRLMTPVDLTPQLDQDSFETLVRPLRQGGRGPLKFEAIHQRKDGTHYNAEYQVQLTTYQDLPLYIATVLDTSARTANAVELEEREARLQAILNTAVEAIVVIDQHGVCESVNPAAEAMFGYAAAEVVGNNVSMLMPSPYREEHDGYLANYLQTGQKKIIGIGREVVGRRKSGEEFPIYLAVSEVQLADRRIFTGFIQDISQHKESQRRLVQSERLAALGEAMASLAHESRNSLQRIQIAVETARLHSDARTPLAEQLDAIEKASDGLDALLSELKNYAAPLRLEKMDACLVGVWREAWLSTAPLRVGRSANLNEDISSARIACRVDRFRMEQVFRNLFENSLAACEDPVQITVSVSETHGNSGKIWRMRVLDNGPGLDQQQIAKIFEPFFTTKSKGTGLGMAIASRIVEAHGGVMSVGSPDQGTEIIIDIPQGV